MNTAVKKIGFGLFSLFILWHVIAIGVVGPASKSYLRDHLMRVFGPYLQVLKLDRSWPFYAPNPFYGSLLSYEIEYPSGDKRHYELTLARHKFQHAYFRYTNFYAYLFKDPRYSHEKGYDKSVAQFLCRRHSLSGSGQLRFTLKRQQKFTYEDYRQGKRPLDSDFIKIINFGPYSC